MTSGQDAALAALAQAFPNRAIVVIGATALALHYPDFRGTLDLDVCVAIDAAEHARDEVLPTTWRRQRGMPHRWRTDDGLLIDVLPACDRLLADGRVSWPDGVSMDLAGIDLVMRDHHPFGAALPSNVLVASRRALFVAKVVAWLDRPSDRHKDLGDIARLLDDYVEEDDPRRFDEPELADRDWSERPAFLLGIDLRAVASDRHRGRIHEFVRRTGDPARSDRRVLWAGAPSAWRVEDEVPQRRLRALCDGLGLP